MNPARGHTFKRRIRPGLAVLFVCFGCSAGFSASDDAGAGGNASGGAGHAGTNGAGTHAGATHAAGSNAAGASVAGADANGGSATGEAGEAGVSGAPSGAGGAASAGTAGRGTAGAAAHGGKGGDCELMECFVANTCLDKCGGKVMYTGCCACEPTWVNKFTCTGTD